MTYEQAIHSDLDTIKNLLEFYGLPSNDLNESHRGLTTAEHVFKLVEKKATNSGMKSFYLLTDTAIKYFKRFKFSICSRNNALTLFEN
ncbi:MAG: N-acetylglutamate synthase-like GNAT family acetyltransferase [Cellvibrionaceae bacterium]|jgi:N-acetylglutamate synthase-like GNAT family acetyltransferase